MKCKNCGGQIRFEQGIGICDSCGSKFELTGAYENTEIFIAYLETDAQGRRTADSIFAEELYRKLDSAKIQTFYERISASDLADDTLEQTLHQAIYQAKIILLVGCDPAHFSALLEEYGSEFTDKTILPVYSKMNAYDLPQELQKLQAMNYDSVGASADLTQRILTLLGREDELDIMQIADQVQKKRRLSLIIGMIATLLLLLAGVGVFIFFKILPGIRQDQAYEEAISAYEEKRFADALLHFWEYADYKDSKNQLFKVFSQYNGYYKTKDKKSDLFLSIGSDFNATIEINLQNNTGKKTTIEETVLTNGTVIEFTYTDSNHQSGTATIVLQNEGLLLKVPEADREVFFLLTDKTDRSVGNTVSKDLLIDWLRKTKSVKEIQDAGYELILEKSLPAPDGGVTPRFEISYQYKIQDTDIQLLFVDTLDPIRNNHDDYTSFMIGEKSSDPERCEIAAVCAPATLLLSDKIGKTTDITFFSDDLLYSARLSHSAFLNYSPFVPNAGCWFYNKTDDNRNDDVWGTKLLTKDDRLILASKSQLGNGLWTQLLYEKNIYSSLSKKETLKTFSTDVVEESEQRILLTASFNGRHYYAIYETETHEFLWELNPPSTKELFIYDLYAMDLERFREFVTDEQLQTWKENGMLTGLSAENPNESGNESSEPTSKTMYVTANDPLNLRAQANTESEVLVAIPVGEAVTVISVDGEWAQVQFDGKSGYCSLQYLSEQQPS